VDETGFKVLVSFPAGHLFLEAIDPVLLLRVSLSEGICGRIAYCVGLCGYVVGLSPFAFCVALSMTSGIGDFTLASDQCQPPGIQEVKALRATWDPLR
jgi:hypothetical protein